MYPTTASQPYTILLSFIIVGLFRQIKGSCIVEVNSAKASALLAPGRLYPDRSCTTCDNATSPEVHILHMKQPTGTTGSPRRGDVKTVKVNIRMNITRSIVEVKLLLASYDAANWIISTQDSVYVSKVVLMSRFDKYSTVKLKDGGYPYFQIMHTILGMRDYASFMNAARDHLGTVTSYSGVKKTSEWWLTAGECSSTPIPTPTGPPLDLTTPDMSNCVYRWKHPCWVEYNFVYDSPGDECTGKQYVYEYLLDRRYYIGAILCTNTRYSLFMSTALEDTFLGMIDTDGEGQDHCEVVGIEFEDRGRAITWYKRVRKPAFSRARWGRHFTQRTMWYGNMPQWYECAITIPTGERVPVPTTEAPTSPLTKQSFNWVAFVAIIGSLIIGLIVTCAFIRGCRKNETPEPDHAMRVQRRAVPPSPVHSAHPAPSAPPIEPPTLEEHLLPPPPPGGRVDEDAPPAYEDIMNYPPARPTAPSSSYSNV